MHELCAMKSILLGQSLLHSWILVVEGDWGVGERCHRWRLMHSDKFGYCRSLCRPWLHNRIWASNMSHIGFDGMRANAVGKRLLR